MTKYNNIGTFESKRQSGNLVSFLREQLWISQRIGHEFAGLGHLDNRGHKENFFNFAKTFSGYHLWNSLSLQISRFAPKGC